MRRCNRGAGHRGFGRRGLLVTAVLALAVPVATTSTAPAGAGPGADVKGRHLRYGYDLDQLTNLDPAKSGNTCDGNVWQFIYGNLIKIDTKGNLSPGLLESWNLQGTTLTLRLRPGLTFQDGEKFDAAALKSGLDHNNTNPNLTALDLITSIDVVDDVTVRLNLKDQTGQQLLYALPGQDGFIVAPKAQKNANKKPVGAGPFKFKSFSHGKRLELVRFDNYYDNANWKLSGIDFTQLGFGPEVVTALKAGDVDLIRFLSESYKALKSDKSIGIGATPSQQYAQFEFRINPPFDKVQVRQAIEFAIDRKRINDVVEAGQGEITDQQFPKDSPYHVPELDGMYTYDPARARELLRDAGFPNGFSFTMVIPGGNIANMERQASIIQDNLKAVGIKAKIKRILPTDIATTYYIQKVGDVFSAEQPAEPFAPNQYYGNFGKFQFVAIHDKAERQDITDLSTQAFQAQDRAQLQAIMKQMTQIAVNEALDVPLVFVPQFAAWDKTHVAGSPVAPTNSCIPTDLRNVSIKS
jgi:peptide/nickel transport system substrate-binding protein